MSGMGMLLAMGYLVGILASCLFVLCAMPFLIYSLCAGNARRALVASRIGSALAQASVLVSILYWILLLSGDAGNDSDPDTAFQHFIAASQQFTLLVSILSAVRQAVRRHETTGEAAPAGDPPKAAIGGVRRADIVFRIAIPTAVLAGVWAVFPRTLIATDKDTVVSFLQVLFGIGPMFGFLFALGAIPFLIYGFFARDPRRAAKSSKIALRLSVAAVAVSIVSWLALVPGAPIFVLPNTRDDAKGLIAAFQIVAIVEVLVLVPAILCAVRNRARRLA